MFCGHAMVGGGGGSGGGGCRGVFVAFRGGGVPPSSPNPDLFSQ